MKKIEFEDPRKMQELVNMQVDINRIVWAGNVDSNNPKDSSFKNQAERDAYIADRIKSIRQTLKDIELYW